MASDADVLRAFLDETRIAARLHHPNIARIDELGEVDGEWFVRMEYVEGASLADVMKNAAKAQEPIALDAVLYIGACLASALDYAHDASDAEGRPLRIVHRDVTPQNVLLSRTGVVKLIDFGVARAEQRFQRTVPGLVKGKLAYMSPEQADGRRVDGRTDTFALGVCLWEALTGRRLFRAATPAETMQKLFACQVSPPSLYRARVPPEVDALVLKALARDPANRFKRASDFTEALETVMDQYDLTSGQKSVAAHVRRLVPEAGHADGLAPDEEPTSAVDLATSELSAAVTRHERGTPRPPPEARWQPDAAVTLLEDEPHAASMDLHVPLDDEPLIGRAAELAELHQLIGAGDRLITLLGPGGVGKSRLAREVARQQVSNFHGRVWVADLTPAKDLEGLCVVVSEALGVALPPGAPVEAVGALLAARRSCLLVLDNAERLPEETADAVTAWLAAAKGVHFLLCSRVALDTKDERAYELGPLPVDGSGDVESDAAQLFLERARLANPAFPTGRWAKDLVKELVRRLDGMPLAIELAAAQMADSPLESLQERSRGASTTAQFVALDEAFESSWRQLADEERAALAQCTVFTSGFTAEAALEVLRLPGHPGDQHREAVLAVLHRLRSKSLLRASFSAKSDQARYGMYESIRQRVAARLPTEEARAKKRHASWFLRFGETLGPEAEKGAAVLDVLATERDNLVAAWNWWLFQGAEGARQALRVVLALDALFVVRGPYGSHLVMLDQTLAKLDSAEARAPGLEARARVLLSRGKLKDAQADLEAVLAHPGDHASQGRALAYLGSVRKQEGSLPEAEALYQRALTLLRRAKDERMQGRVFTNLGAIAQEQGRLDDAQDLYTEALRLHVKAGDRRFEGVTLTNLATLQQVRGRWDEAEQSCTRAIAVHRELGNRRSEGIALTNLADLERDRASSSRATALYRRAVVVHQEVGNRRFEGICLLNTALLLLEQKDLAPAGALLDDALALFHAVGDKRHAGLTLGARGGLRALLGETSPAENDLNMAGEMLGGAGDVPFAAAVDVYRVQLDLARGEALDAAGRDDEGDACRAAARARIDDAKAPGSRGSVADRFEHVRMALRVLKAWGVTTTHA